MSRMISKLSMILTLIFFSTVSIQAGNVSAYYNVPYTNAKDLESKLSKAGFSILTSYSPAEKSNIKVIVFTNEALSTMASQQLRGFAAIQRVMVDASAKTVLATNPTYWLQAFMQKDYKSDIDKEITAALKQALGPLTASKDVLESADLSDYQFMLGMPYYQDMIELKSGLTLNINSDKKLFEIKLRNGSILIGVKMSKVSENFINKLGENKAILLPYTILIERGQAYALHAKYYLAISYPLLSMGDFMDISSIPGTIERSLKKSIK